MLDSSKRNLFRNLTKKKSLHVRPPYAQELTQFEQLCLTCKEKTCQKVCEEQVIKIVDEIVSLDFSRSGCSYCEACLDVCDVLVDKETMIAAKIEIDITKCVSYHGVMCFSCKDPCLDDAIAFDGLFYPKIIEDTCTSCGYCISRCPSEAIKVLL